MKLFAAMATLLLIHAPPAAAEMGEGVVAMPTDNAASHLFLLNPAALKPTAAQGGALMVRGTRTSKLTQPESDLIETETSDDYLGFGALLDLGAGAGLGLSHQTLHRQWVTSVTTNDTPREESLKEQQSGIKLLVELMDELRAGMVVRYLYKDYTILGDPFLDDDESTRYKMPMIGYGSGFAYFFKQGALGYAYYPPLRGKTTVYGEELIVVEPGEIVVDANFQPSDTWNIGLSAKRWLHDESDDRNAGTTASDNQTNISLYGLSPDQYFRQTQQLMLGADVQLTKQAGLRFAVGQEQGEYQFIEHLTFNRIDVRQDEEDRHQGAKYQRFKAMINFVNQGMQLNAGAGLVKLANDMPDSMNGATYEVDGKDLFVTLDMKL
jgi:hypothetical protein